ncbi:C1 family peptidase, partial [Solirubrobacter soli]|uniref:C1 family peptidase n=1 Tax=Solirubrobacter soli TaxID=363832 RepID=UPI00069E8FCB
MSDPIVAAVKAANPDWEWGETSLLQLSAEERDLRLGYVPGPGEPTLEEQEEIAREAAAAAAPAAEIGAPPAQDWRNVGGRSYVGPIRDQGGCGSCVAFGTAATIEARARVASGNPGLGIDLSEAHLFYCIAASQGRNCANGWWPDQSFEGARTQGVCDEACFPYTAHDQPCNRCGDWGNRVTKVTAWHKITNVNDMKAWLASSGPLAACFNVYDDFYAYRSGVYRHVSGALRGGHCVCIVGYSDTDRCWIAKNSWGAGWGESGFFRIAYGDCGIDSAMWAADNVALPGGWSGWASEGGVLTSNTTVARNADGRLEAFARGTDNALWHKWQVTPNGGWSGWASEGGVLTSNIPVARNADGRLEAFVRGTDGALWHKWQVSPGGGWSGWASEGGVLTSDIAVAQNADG